MPVSPLNDPTTVRVSRAAMVDRLRTVAGFLGGLPARAALGLIWIYQHSLSPALPLVFGPACGCRFSPTCSHYAAEAVRSHGALFGTLLALRRIVKCSPLHPGGFDPVPPRRFRSRPVCARPSRPASARP